MKRLITDESKIFEQKNKKNQCLLLRFEKRKKEPQKKRFGEEWFYNSIQEVKWFIIPISLISPNTEQVLKSISNRYKPWQISRNLVFFLYFIGEEESLIDEMITNFKTKNTKYDFRTEFPITTNWREDAIKQKNIFQVSHIGQIIPQYLLNDVEVVRNKDVVIELDYE